MPMSRDRQSRSITDPADAGAAGLLSRRHGGAGALLVLGAALLWATAGLAGAIAHQRSGLPALAIGFWRLAVGAVATLPLLRGRTAAIGSDRAHLVGVGVGLATYQACYFAAVTLAGVSLATLVTLGVAPLLIAAGGRLVLRERPQRATAVALVAALGGLVLLVGAPTAGNAGAALPAAGLACASAAGYAAVTVLTRQRRGGGAVSAFTAAALGVAAVAALPGALATGHWLPRDAVTLLLLAYLGAGPTALAYLAYFRGLATVTATTAGVLTLLEPAGATLLAVVLLGERLGARGVAGAMLLTGTALALTLVQARGARRHAAAR